MSHLDEGILHAMLDGEIGSTELKAIEVHLAGCGACGARLEEARRFRDESLAMLVSLDEEPAPVRFAAAAAAAPMAADPRQRPARARRLPAWAPGLAWAATIVAAIGLGWSLRVSDLRAPADGSGASPAPAAELPAAPPAPPAGTAAKPSAPPSEPARDRRAAKDQSQTGVVMADAAPPAAAPAAAAPPVAQPAQNESQRSALGARLSARREGDLAKKSLLAPAVSAADELVLHERAEPGPNSISAAKAIEILGGSIRLVDGLTPVRFELNGDVVRVVYETTFGRLILEQWRAANVVSHRLVAPRSAPADSVLAWAERVR